MERLTFELGLIKRYLYGKCHWQAFCAGARFSKAPVIKGPVKLLLFTCKIEVSVGNYQLVKQNGIVC